MADKEMVLVQSKVRDLIREKELRVSEEFITALNEHVHQVVANAMKRCKDNERQTLRPQDV